MKKEKNRGPEKYGSSPICGEEMRPRRRENAKEDAKKKGNLLLGYSLRSGARAGNLDLLCRTSSRLPSRFRAFVVVFLPPQKREINQK
jgi:hypothetical protein